MSDGSVKDTAPPAGGRAEAILDVAEARIRKGGFDAVSFRDIAAAVGIKSASVHYHFPHKADLGRAVVARYTERFLAALGSPSDPGETAAARLDRLAAAYEGALTRDASSCLCAVLGAVASDLPAAVSAEVAEFYAQLLRWTEVATAGLPGAEPRLIISQLQGAMILAVALGRPQVLADAAADLRARFDGA